jgi:hypothetical protein
LTVKSIDLTLEHEIQADVIDLYERLRCTVIRYAERRRTLVTPGHADLKVYCPRKACSWLHEVKTPSGTQSAEQVAFQQLVESCGETYILGGTEAAIDQLRAIGCITGRAVSNV